jgi:predicted HicB family RNase H-like nuclease
MIRGYSVRLDWSEVDDAYVAISPEFPGLVGVDGDANLALDELREAIEMAIEVLEEDGEPLPERKPLNEHSGQFRLRVPKALHALLSRQADEESVSLNTYVATILAHAAGVHAAESRVSSELRQMIHEMRVESYVVLPPPEISGSAATDDDFATLVLGGRLDESTNGLIS